jgi:hypothetical protein
MADLNHIHNLDASQAFQNMLDEYGSVGKDQLKMEKLEAQMGNDLEGDSFAIDIFDPELYECTSALYGSEKEAQEDYEALLALCKDHKLYKIPCSWEMYGHIAVRAESVEEACRKADSGEHPQSSGSEIMGSFKFDDEAIAEMDE